MMKKLVCAVGLVVLVVSLSACGDNNIKQYDKESNLNLLDSMAVHSETDKELYKNEKMNIQFEIPVEWSSKYIIEDTGARISFVHKSIHDKYDFAGQLCYLAKVSKEELAERSSWAQEEILWENEEYAYVLGLPTDVQAPDWDNRDEEDALLVEEYNKMCLGIPHIKETFSVIK